MDGASALEVEVDAVVWPLPEGALKPSEQEEVTIRRSEYIELKARANYYEKQHAKATRKIGVLEATIEKLKAQLRDVRQRFFGRRSEKGTSKRQAPQSEVPGKTARRSRGQQWGSAGHGRTPVDHLPVVQERRELTPQHKRCGKCHQLLKAGPSRISEIIEIATVIFRRRIVRESGCRCECEGGDRSPSEVGPAIVAAAAAGRLIRKGKLGVSIWVEVLLEKFHHVIPTNRLLQRWADLGLKRSPGTISDGLKQLLPLFKPLMKAFKAQQLSEHLFNADETFWRVFEKIAEKVGYRWYLWTFVSPSVCFYILDPSRSAKVPLSHFGELLQSAVLMVDRYSAYKKLPRTLSILLAFCWAHVRRDWIELARNYPPLKSDALGWVERIGLLYHLNKQRLKAGAADFAAWDAKLRAHVKHMAEQCAAELADPKLHPAARKCLESLQRHWQGLTLFVEHPEIEMDNNRAERMLRKAVCGRKSFYGSGARWSAELAASLFTVFMTLQHCWKINPRRWLTEYLQACADNAGSTPADLSSFLPWAVSPERLKILRTPLPPQSFQFDTS